MVIKAARSVLLRWMALMVRRSIATCHIWETVEMRGRRDLGRKEMITARNSGERWRRVIMI